MALVSPAPPGPHLSLPGLPGSWGLQPRGGGQRGQAQESSAWPSPSPSCVLLCWLPVGDVSCGWDQTGSVPSLWVTVLSPHSSRVWPVFLGNVSPESLCAVCDPGSRTWADVLSPRWQSRKQTWDAPAAPDPAPPSPAFLLATPAAQASAISSVRFLDMQLQPDGARAGLCTLARVVPLCVACHL